MGLSAYHCMVGVSLARILEILLLRTILIAANMITLPEFRFDPMKIPRGHIVNCLLQSLIGVLSKLWHTLNFILTTARTASLSSVIEGIHIMSWFICIKLGLRYKHRQHLLDWVNDMVASGSKSCSNFTKDWSDGVVVCALAEAVLPGSFPRYDLLNPGNANENLDFGLRVIEIITKFRSMLTPEELSKGLPESEKKLMRLIVVLMIRYGSGQLQVCASDLQRSMPCTVIHRGCIAKGMGLMQAVKGRKSHFNIYFKSCSDLNIVIEIKGPKNSVCSKLITNRSPQLTGKCAAMQQKTKSTENSRTIQMDYDIFPKKLSVAYMPIYAGKHEVSIVWQGRHMIGSPYCVRVDESMDIEGPVKKKKLPKLLSLHKMASFDIPDEDFDLWATKESAVPHDSSVVKKRRIVRQVIVINGEEIMVDEPFIETEESTRLGQDLHWFRKPPSKAQECTVSKKAQKACCNEATKSLSSDSKINNASSDSTILPPHPNDVIVSEPSKISDVSNSTILPPHSNDIIISEPSKISDVSDSTIFPLNSNNENMTKPNENDEVTVELHEDLSTKPYSPMSLSTGNGLEELTGNSEQEVSSKCNDNPLKDPQTLTKSENPTSLDNNSVETMTPVNLSEEKLDFKISDEIISEGFMTPELLLPAEVKSRRNNCLESEMESSLEIGVPERVDFDRRKWAEPASSADSLDVLVNSFATSTDDAEEMNGCLSGSVAYHDDFIKRQGFWENMSSADQFPDDLLAVEDESKERKASLVKQKCEFWERQLR